MTLQKREKTLAAAVGVLLVGMGLWMAIRVGLGPLAVRRDAVAALESKLAKKQEQIDAWETGAKAKLADWRKRSLPSDPQLARTVYQNWLLDQATQVKFRRPKVESTDGRVVKIALPRSEGKAPQPRSEAGAGLVVYHALPFSLQCEGTLEQLTDFLYRFYAAGHLHRIRRLNVKPGEKDPTNLELTVAVEALSLPEADRRDKLTSVAGSRLALTDLEPYRKAIVERSLFTPYKPPLARREEKKEEKKVETFDPSKYAYVTAIVAVGGERQVWLRLRTKDEKLQLRQGERFEIGPMKGTIARIEERFVEIEADGKRSTIALGEPINRPEGERIQ